MDEINVGDKVRISAMSSKYAGAEGVVVSVGSRPNNSYAYSVELGKNTLPLSFYKSELSVVKESKDAVSINVNSNEGPALFYLGTDGVLYRLDEGPYVPDKESYFMLALMKYVQDGINGDRKIQNGS